MMRTAFLVVSVLFAITQILRLRYCLYKCIDKHDIAISIASCFVSFTLPITIAHTIEHIAYFVKPNLQCHIVRILWLVPVFSLKSYLSIMFVEQSFYFQSIREIYEAYVIYSFMRYLLNFLGDRNGSSALADKLATLPSALGFHRLPFCFLAPWQMGGEFLRRCKIGVFQYVLVRVTSTLLALLLFMLHQYDINDESWTSLPSLFILINSLSQTWALYSLMLFYQVAQKPLISVMPFYKFFCIKAVVFFTWWQSILLYVLVSFGQIRRSKEHSTKEVGALIHDLLICIEMSVAALGFLHSFSVLDFAPSNGTPTDSPLAKNKFSELDLPQTPSEPPAAAAVGGPLGVLDFVKECFFGYSETEERQREELSRRRGSTTVFHTAAAKDISKSALLLSGEAGGEALFVVDAVLHVLAQTEVVSDLKDVASHGYEKFLKEWTAYLRRRCIKERSDTLH